MRAQGPTLRAPRRGGCKADCCFLHFGEKWNAVPFTTPHNQSGEQPAHQPASHQWASSRAGWVSLWAAGVTQESWSVKGPTTPEWLLGAGGISGATFSSPVLTELPLLSAKPGDPSEDKTVGAGACLSGEERAAGRAGDLSLPWPHPLWQPGVGFVRRTEHRTNGP